MANVVKTKDQLLTRFASTGQGTITGQDGRDFIVSAFGFPTLGIPNVNYDSADTAGVGAFFDFGSKLLTTGTLTGWICFSGAPGAAVWKRFLFHGEAAGGALTGFYPNPGLGAPAGATGIPATVGDSTHIPILQIDADGRISGAAETTFSAGSGTVTSVEAAGPAGDFTWSPAVTSSGTLTAAWATKTANFVLAGPTSGAAATPAFRALVPGDIPSLPGSIIGSGSINVAYIPSLPGSIIGSGSINVAYIPSLPGSIIGSGTVAAAYIDNLDAAKITSGIIDAARLPGGGAPAFTHAYGVAAAGLTQSSATAITTNIVEVTSLTGGSDTGVRLPDTSGPEIVFITAGGNVGLQVWPDSGSKINAGATDAVFGGMPTAQFLGFIRCNATQWRTLTSL